MAAIVKGDSKASFSLATTPSFGKGATPFPGLLHFTYLIMLSVKQEGTNYYFLSFWDDSTWGWTLVSRAIVYTIAVIYIQFIQYIYVYISDKISFWLNGRNMTWKSKFGGFYLFSWYIWLIYELNYIFWPEFQFLKRLPKKKKKKKEVNCQHGNWSKNTNCY